MWVCERNARTVRPVVPSTASTKRDSIARWKACRDCADGVEFACLDERAFGRGVDVLEEADDVVFAEDGADGVGAATVVLSVELGHRVGDGGGAGAAFAELECHGGCSPSLAPRRLNTREE